MKKKYWVTLAIFIVITPILAFVIRDQIDDYKFRQNLASIMKEVSVNERIQFARDWEKDISSSKGPGWIIMVTTFGSDNKKIKAQAPWANKTATYNTMSKEFTILLKNYGFEEITFTDGSDLNTWKFDLTEER